MCHTDVHARLLALRDASFADFQRKLIPTVAPERILGVRTPRLRALAKELAREWTKEEMDAFLRALPHTCFEENNLHGFLIENMNEYERVLRELDAFLPYIDNWATCDGITPKVFRKHLAQLRQRIPAWLASAHAYTVRFGVEMLLCFYLDDAFTPEYLDWVAHIRYPDDAPDAYYVRMIIAWFFATALAKQYDATIPYIQRSALETWTHNKAIQKAIESYRVDDAHKAYLRTLKRRR